MRVNIEISDEISLVPWEVRPYDLVSWWDMVKFSAGAFYHIGALIAESKKVAEIGVSNPSILETEVYQNHMSLLRRLLNTAEGYCGDIGLRQSLKAIARAKSDLAGSPAPREILNMLNSLDTRITDEMEDCLFMFIPGERASYYNQKEMFGTDVTQAFPIVQFDVVEAGNCYAAGRGTAVVFHLMRIMETGVQRFGAKLGIQLAGEKNWQNILDEINKAIKALPPKNPQTISMSQASANLYAVKLAWRNEVMHPKDTYTLEEAENLIRVVKMFMQQLAMIV